jgi:hypothetical protein
MELQLDATVTVFIDLQDQLNMFRANFCPSSGAQDLVFFTTYGIMSCKYGKYSRSYVRSCIISCYRELVAVYCLCLGIIVVVFCVLVKLLVCVWYYVIFVFWVGGVKW